MCKPPDSRHFVYALIDPRDSSVFYIGKSTMGLKRPRQHGLEFFIRKDEQSNWQKAALIRACQALRLGELYNGRILGYAIEVIEEIPAPKDYFDDAACFLHGSALGLLERIILRCVRSLGLRTLNRGDGGENIVGNQRGKAQSLESNEKRRATQKGKPRDPEAIAKTAAAHRGMKRSEETKAKMAVKRRERKDVRRITYMGQTRILSEWATLLGTDRVRISRRLELGWSVERALTEPPKTTGRPKGWKLSLGKETNS